MTPLENYPELAKILGVKDLYFKREDLHPYGSHKGRSLPLMIEHYYDKGDRNFAISSSGNAGIASALYITEFNNKNDDKISLDVLVGPLVNQKKLSALKNLAQNSKEKIRILTKERPLQALAQLIEEGKRSLRQSTDDTALLGYETLAEELSKTQNLSAIFIGTSSGTTAEALADYFSKENLKVQIHAVQTSSCHPLSDQFENYDGPSEKSLADAIVSKTSQRINKLIPLIKNSGGYCWTATNEDILTAKKLTLEHTGQDISNNSALSIAGIMLAKYRDWDIPGPVVAMICGL